MDIHSLPDIIATLCRQESTSYQCGDYLSPEFQTMRHDCPKHIKLEAPLSHASFESSNASGKINEYWREKICEWCYQVIDHFDFNREVVEISLSYLDRFLCTRTVTKKAFQLAAMTCLYMAIKLYEPTSLKISSIIELSRGYFTIEHIVAMENTILRELSWHMHPPTSLSFVKHIVALFDLCQIECSASTRHDLGEMARFLCELSVCDYFFVTKKPSSIAIAALQTAMDKIDIYRLSPRSRTLLLTAIRDVARLDLHSNEVTECRFHLNEMYMQGCYGGNHENIPDTRGSSPNFVGDMQSSSLPKCVSPP